MSWINGAELVLTHKPATREFLRRLAHERRMEEKRGRSPSRRLVAEAMQAWRTWRGYEGAVYPEGWDEMDFTARVKWAKEVLAVA